MSSSNPPSPQNSPSGSTTLDAPNEDTLEEPELLLSNTDAPLQQPVDDILSRETPQAATVGSSVEEWIRRQVEDPFVDPQIKVEYLFKLLVPKESLIESLNKMIAEYDDKYLVAIAAVEERDSILSILLPAIQKARDKFKEYGIKGDVLMKLEEIIDMNLGEIIGLYPKESSSEQEPPVEQEPPAEQESPAEQEPAVENPISHPTRGNKKKRKYWFPADPAYRQIVDLKLLLLIVVCNNDSKSLILQEPCCSWSVSFFCDLVIFPQCFAACIFPLYHYSVTPAFDTVLSGNWDEELIFPGGKVILSIQFCIKY